MKKLFLFTVILSMMFYAQVYSSLVITGKYTCEDRPNCYFIIKINPQRPNTEGTITYYDGNMGVSMEGRLESTYGNRIMTVYWSTGLVESLNMVNNTQFYSGDFKWVRKGPAK